MALKPRYRSLADVPDSIHEFYVEKDGAAVLAIDGMVPAVEAAKLKGKVDDFRDTNVGLKAKVEQLETKLESFGDVAPDEVQDLQKRLSEFEDKKGVKKPEDIDAQINEAVEKQTQKAIKPLQDTIQELTEREERAQQELRQSRLKSTLRDAASKAGVAESAVPDFLSRAMETFNVDDEGNVVAQRDGRTLYDDSTAEPLKPEVWANNQLRKEAPHLFKSSKGGGAGGGPGGGPDGRKTYDPKDNKQFIDNLEDIATGEAVPATGQ